MSKYSTWPHGLCECREHCDCCLEAGPAALQVTRRGDLLKVCTRCVLTEDVDRKVLLEEEDNIVPLFAYDALGLVVLALREKERGGKPV